jgi:hypothetical protein
MGNKKEGLVRGRFSSEEDDFIRNNHNSMNDKAIAAALNRDVRSVTNRRGKLGIQTRRNKPKITEEHRDAFLATLDEKDRRKFFEKEVRASARFRAVCDSLTVQEQNYYIEKYTDFMLDPTIETMTAMEKDALHQLLLAEMRINRHMAEEKEWLNLIKDWDTSNGKPPAAISRAKEIRECQEVILKCQASLNVERKQRLKNQRDQSITFTNLIKEMKNPQTRYKMGVEATMLKVIAEQYYNGKLGKNIFSGNERSFDMSKNFREGAVPDLPEDFMAAVKNEEETDKTDKSSDDNS